MTDERMSEERLADHVDVARWCYEYAECDSCPWLKSPDSVAGRCDTWKVDHHGELADALAAERAEVDRLTAIRAAFERTAGMNGSNTTWMVRAIAAEDAADRLTDELAQERKVSEWLARHSIGIHWECDPPRVDTVERIEPCVPVIIAAAHAAVERLKEADK